MFVVSSMAPKAHVFFCVVQCGQHSWRHAVTWALFRAAGPGREVQDGMRDELILFISSNPPMDKYDRVLLILGSYF